MASTVTLLQKRRAQGVFRNALYLNLQLSVATAIPHVGGFK
jgi:hypothetical protein